MKKRNPIILNSMFFCIFILGFVLYQNWLSHKNKQTDFSGADITKITGTLKQLPYHHRQIKEAESLTIILNEYPYTEFENIGIDLIPLDIKNILSNSRIGDSVQISVKNQEITTKDLDGQTLSFCELQINNKAYLSLDAYNRILKKQRPAQQAGLWTVVIILIIIILVQLKLIFKS